MSENIMKDNLMYLEAWMNYNPQLRECLSIDNTNLIFQKDGIVEQVDISNFYLAEMLYNENFREKVAVELNSEDLFQIIKLYIQTEEIFEAERKDESMSPKIQEVLIKQGKDGKEFIVLIDENRKKYRYDTDHLEQVINYYNDIQTKRGSVTLKELGTVIKNGN